jgi:hemolysin III
MEYQDAISSCTHLFTAAWAAFATMVMFRMTRGHGLGRVGVVIYGLSMIWLYLSSGVFHGLLYYMTSITPGRAAAIGSLWVAQRLDKTAIFALIAGSFTPIFIYSFTGQKLRNSLAMIWTLAAVGSISIWTWPKHPELLLVVVYLTMVLAGFVASASCFRRIGWRGSGWVLSFASAYLAGATIEVLKWPTLYPGYLGPHELFHIGDVLGTWLHFGFVMKFFITRPPLYS